MCRDLTKPLSVPDCHPPGRQLPPELQHARTAGLSWPGQVSCQPCRLSWAPGTLGGAALRADTVFSPVCLSGRLVALPPRQRQAPQAPLRPAAGAHLPSPLPHHSGSQLEQPWRSATGIPGKQPEGFCPSERRGRVLSHTNA